MRINQQPSYQANFTGVYGRISTDVAVPWRDLLNEFRVVPKGIVRNIYNKADERIVLQLSSKDIVFKFNDSYIVKTTKAETVDYKVFIALTDWEAKAFKRLKNPEGKRRFLNGCFGDHIFLGNDLKIEEVEGFASGKLAEFWKKISQIGHLKDKPELVHSQKLRQA